jgi:hypothetical protein
VVVLLWVVDAKALRTHSSHLCQAAAPLHPAPQGCFNGAPCPPFTSHGASIRQLPRFILAHACACLWRNRGGDRTHQRYLGQEWRP